MSVGVHSGPPHTCTPTTSFALFNPQLPSSGGGPSSFGAPSQGRVGVLSRVAGADGGRARAQVPVVADTGGETDEDGHWALCQGSLLPVPFRTGRKHVAPEFAKQEGQWVGMGTEKKVGGERQSREGIKGKEGKQLVALFFTFDF